MGFQSIPGLPVLSTTLWKTWIWMLMTMTRTSVEDMTRTAIGGRVLRDVNLRFKCIRVWDSTLRSPLYPHTSTPTHITVTHVVVTRLHCLPVRHHTLTISHSIWVVAEVLTICRQPVPREDGLRNQSWIKSLRLIRWNPGNNCLILEEDLWRPLQDNSDFDYDEDFFSGSDNDSSEESLPNLANER